MLQTWDKWCITAHHHHPPLSVHTAHSTSAVRDKWKTARFGNLWLTAQVVQHGYHYNWKAVFADNVVTVTMINTILIVVFLDCLLKFCALGNCLSPWACPGWSLRGWLGCLITPVSRCVWGHIMAPHPPVPVSVSPTPSPLTKSLEEVTCTLFFPPFF